MLSSQDEVNTPKNSKLSNINTKYHSLNSHVKIIKGQNPSVMTLDGTNTYLILNNDNSFNNPTNLLNNKVGCCLIDTGQGVLDYIPLLDQILQDQQVSTKQQVLEQHNNFHIFITHHHIDHIGGIQYIKSLLNDKYQLEIHLWQYESIEYTRYQNEYQAKHNQLVYHTINVDKSYWILNNSMKLHAIHSPGHCNDHISYKLDYNQQSAIFTGDCILGYGTTAITNLTLYMKSLQVIQDYQANILYPGHGPIIYDVNKTIDYYRNHRNKRIQQVYEYLQMNQDQPKSCLHIVYQIYNNIDPKLYLPAAKSVILSLKKLIDDDLIQEINVTTTTQEDNFNKQVVNAYIAYQNKYQYKIDQYIVQILKNKILFQIIK